MKPQQTIIKAFLILVLSLPLTAFAGGGHDHGHDGGHSYAPKMDRVKLISLSQTHIGDVITRKLPIEGNVLNEKWGQFDHKAVKFAKLKGGFYRIQVQHPENEKKLYLLLNRKEVLTDINHSGKFKNLN